MAPIRALIFDVDGTLAETEEVHRAAFNRAFAEAGLGWHWDQTLYARLLKVPGGLPRLLSYLDTVEPGASAVRRGEMAAVHEAKAALYARMVDERLVQLRPGVERLIETEFMPDIGNRLGGGRSAGELYRRVGRQGVEQHEGDGRDAEQDHQRAAEPAQDQLDHLTSSRAGSGRGCRARRRRPD